jgi:hypothetical protein
MPRSYGAISCCTEQDGKLKRYCMLKWEVEHVTCQMKDYLYVSEEEGRLTA